MNSDKPLRLRAVGLGARDQHRDLRLWASDVRILWPFYDILIAVARRSTVHIPKHRSARAAIG